MRKKDTNDGTNGNGEGGRRGSVGQLCFWREGLRGTPSPRDLPPGTRSHRKAFAILV